MKFINKQYVRWDDLDAIGHVNHAKYLTFAQEARFAMLGQKLDAIGHVNHAK